MCSARSLAWADEPFQSRFLRTLFLHGEFTERYLEQSDINGNHFTADAAAMVFAGLFFGQGVAPRRWSEDGLAASLSRSCRGRSFADGVDFEASVRLSPSGARVVLSRRSLSRGMRPAGPGQPIAIASSPWPDLTLAYSRGDGSSPLSATPTMRARCRSAASRSAIIATWSVWSARTGASPELHAWLQRPARGDLLDARPPRAGICRRRPVNRPRPIASAAFPEGGFYVMRNDRDHVFIDCGPVGLAGRGGHGHNDCLSFEAVLDGVHLVSDCGAYVYTASAEERNRFRSTAYHNTPQVDGEEINRFVALGSPVDPHERRRAAGASLGSRA